MDSRSLNQFDKLSKEIVYDIISRLPIESISHCRFVSKDWYNIVKDPYFVNLHQIRHNSSSSSSSSSSSNGILIVFHTTMEDELELYLLSDDLEKRVNDRFPTINSTNPLSINLDNFPSEFIKVIGSINGIMCIVLVPWNYLFYICNPVIRDVFKIPEPPGLSSSITKSKFEYMYPTSSGFGFHAPTMEYKIVRTWYFKATDTGLVYTGIEIYTIGSGGIWRRIDKEDIVCTAIIKRLPASQVFINGALHWELKNLAKSQSRHCIGAVHIGDEKFTSLETPPVDVGIRFRTLISLRQCLCLIDDFKDHMVVWIMKLYGVAESWTREHVIGKEMFGLLKTVPFIVIKTMKNGSFLLSGGGSHGYYDLDKQEFITILTDPPPKKLDIVAHIGSLISLATIAGKGEENKVQSPIKKNYPIHT